jgi:hypothetical protein
VIDLFRLGIPRDPSHDAFEFDGGGRSKLHGSVRQLERPADGIASVRAKEILDSEKSAVGPSKLPLEGMELRVRVRILIALNVHHHFGLFAPLIGKMTIQKLRGMIQSNAEEHLGNDHKQFQS